MNLKLKNRGTLGRGDNCARLPSSKKLRTGVHEWYDTERFFDEGLRLLEEDDSPLVHVLTTERVKMTNVV